MLVNFTLVYSVQMVHSKVSCLKRPIVINPDLPFGNRRIESIVLRERWSLIKNGYDSRSIRIRNSRLFVSGSLYGTYGTTDGATFNRTNQSPASEVTHPTSPYKNVRPSEHSIATSVSPPTPDSPPSVLKD